MATQLDNLLSLFDFDRMNDRLLQIENAMELVLLFIEKMPDLYAEALSRAAYGSTVTVNGIGSLADAFVTAVDQYAFPLQLDFFLDDGQSRYESNLIPLVLFGIDEEEIEAYKGSNTVQVLFIATACAYSAVFADDIEGFVEYAPFDDELLSNLLTPDASDGLNLIVDRLRLLPEGHIARDGGLAVLRLMAFENENIFLDASYACSCGLNEIVWDDEWYDYLVEMWLKAEPIVSAAHRFLQWLYEEGFEREVAFIEYLAGRRDTLENDVR